MDYLTFISNIIASLAWPIVILIIVLIFKNQLIQIIQRIRNFNFGNGKLTVDLTETMEKLDKLTSKEEMAAAKEAEKEIKGITFKDILEEYPETAIFLSWRDLEGTIRRKAEELGLYKGYRYYNLYELLEQFSRYTSLEPDSRNIYKDLATLRNKVFHNQEVKITPDDASRFVDFALLLKNRISNSTLGTKDNSSTDK